MNEESTQQPPAAPEAISDERRTKLIRFALWKLIREATDQAIQAAQDKANRYFKAGDAEAFMRDAKDAATILATFEVVAQPKEQHDY